MTRIVKDYITRKIREGAQPKLDKLRRELAQASENRVGDGEFAKAVYASPEYKALEAFIRKLAKDKKQRAKADLAYANSSYLQEMEQNALKTEAQKMLA